MNEKSAHGQREKKMHAEMENERERDRGENGKRSTHNEICRVRAANV